MMPENVKEYIIEFTENKKDDKVIEIINILKENGHKDNYINELLLSKECTKKILNQLNIQKKICFYIFYLNGFDLPNNTKGEELFGLQDIYDFYINEYWINRCELREKYPKASKQYLQFTSIEGGGSYFYDKETDYVYDVDWGQEEAMITGKLKPWFTSFYDFLEWYYSEEDENNEEIEKPTSETIQEKKITLSQLSSIIPWAGLKTIEEYNDILSNICKDEEFKEYTYLFEDIQYSANDDKLKETKLSTNLVSEILDKLGMVIFYRQNSLTLSSLSYEKENTQNPRLCHEWAHFIRKNGFENVQDYSYLDETIMKTSQALIRYGYEAVEKVYERTQISLEDI